MDTTTPLVSVIMSVYNGEQWLKLAIDSIIHQTYPKWELIIIDDASNEPARQILQSYTTDPRITIHRRDTHFGLIKNLNLAIDLSKGEYIARMDADDISVTDRLAKQVAYLQQHPNVDLIASFITMINEKGETTGVWPDDRKSPGYQAIKTILPRTNCIAHPSVMLRAPVLKQYRYNEHQIHMEDWDLWLRLLNDGKIIEKISEPLLLYRVHSSSVTSTYLKGYAFQKKYEFYKQFLSETDPGPITSRIRLISRINRVKLFLSRIKRSFTS